MTSDDDDVVIGSAMWRSVAGKMNQRRDMDRRGKVDQRWQRGDTVGRRLGRKWRLGSRVMAGSRMHDDDSGDGSLGTQGSAMGCSRADSKVARRGAAAEHRQGDGAQLDSATGRSSRQQGRAKLKQQQGTDATVGRGNRTVHAQRFARRYAGLGRSGWMAIRQDDGADRATAKRVIGGWQVSTRDECQDATVKAQSTRRPQS